MVATYQPLRVVIIDYGHATSEARSTDHYKGSIPYLAPEVLALKHQKTSAPYERSCDIWSLGLSAYQLFLGKRCDWGPGVNNTSHRSIIQRLEEQKTQIPVCEVLKKMLAWEPRDRLSISEVIADPIWEDINKAQPVRLPKQSAPNLQRS
jgi:serine/threonine protein kinase